MRSFGKLAVTTLGLTFVLIAHDAWNCGEMIVGTLVSIPGMMLLVWSVDGRLGGRP